jgi:hypothetical protein
MVWQKLLSGVPVCKANPVRRGSFTAAFTLVGLGLNFVKIDPIRALFWAAIINGVVAVPVMIVTMLLSTSKNCHEGIQNSVDTQDRWVGSNIDDALGFDWFVRGIETITVRCGPLHRFNPVAFCCFNFS